MRRTYRSKKDAGNALDRRDLLLNLDEKSTAYDAFFIQNIKQTKRELSCIGSSNSHAVASNRVRKRKYVKRIVKEPGTPCRESLSQSTYLTPDKSIRVNKPMDPFDRLLNSSVFEPETVTVTKKVDLFDKLKLPSEKKEKKGYTRRRPIKPKKVNYSSSDYSDSDKENSDEKFNITRNTSDIKAFQLVIENEAKNSPKRFDDSINKIVNNISLLNKIKHKTIFNDSIKGSPTYNKHRLTRNINSPILQKSPLCSTPFKVKYRGESIYKFSPIAFTNSEKSPVSNNILEENSGSIIYMENKNKSNESVHTSGEDFTPNNSIEYRVENKELTAVQEIIQSCNNPESPKLISKTMPSSEISNFQTSEVEPFLGFSNKPEQNINNDSDFRISPFDESQPQCSIVENDNYEEPSQNGNSPLNSIANDDSDKVSLDSQDNKRDSLYDTCTSDQSMSEDLKDEVPREPIVKINRMNDSSFLRYYEKMNHYSSDDDDTGDISMCKDEEINEFNDVIDIENSAENLSQDEEFASFENSDISSSDLSEKSPNTNACVNNDLMTNDICENIEILSSNDDEECNEDEKVVSFVTTRRRNEITNNSMMSMFNDSYTSSSTDCDKTVLSNKLKTDEMELNENITLMGSEDHREDDFKIADSNKGTVAGYVEVSTPNVSCCTEKKDARFSFVPARSSDITDDKSPIIGRKSSIKSRPTNRKSSIKPKQSNKKSSVKPKEASTNSFNEENISHSYDSFRKTCFDKPGIVLQPGKKWERSLSIYRRMTLMTDHFDESVLEEEAVESKGRKYRQSVISTMVMQELNGSLHNESINSRRSTFVSKPSRSTIRFVKDPDISRLSLCNTTVFDDLKGFLNEECDDTIIELSKLSIADQTHEVTVLDTFHDTTSRLATARDYVLRRCNQTDAILFDECYPDSLLKNCHKIGEGVYGEVFLWRARDGRARVLKIVPVAGTLKVNGESQKDFHEIISEIVIAMELSALRAPIAEINRQFDEGKDVEALELHAIENATDIFNEVLAVRCVYGSYPARLLDLWDLYDECKGSENDNPAILPADQQFIVLELANAGQDLESYQFNNAEQAYALFLQVAYGLAVAEEAFQFEHRDLHWGNVLIAPSDQKYSTFVLRGRSFRVARCGVAGTIIDYSLSRVSLPLAAGDSAALYNDLSTDDSLFDAVGDYQFEIYRLMRHKLGNDWKNFEPYTNILWLHYTVDKMITSLRYKRTNTKIHKHYIDKLKGIKSRILDYGSAALFVLTDNEI